MNELIFLLNKNDKNSLGTVRGIEGLKAAEDEDHIWLRGLYNNGALDKSIRQLPLLHNFFIDEDNLLFSPGSLTPERVLPLLEWLPVAEFISIKIPVAALPGQLEEPALFKIVPAVVDKKGIALLTTLEQWKVYAESAPAIRLAPLQFALSQKNEVLVVGTPLPSIPGKEYWQMNNMLLPCGYELEIPVAASFICEKLNPENDGFLIFDTDGSCEKIDFAFLVAAKRSAARLTSAVGEGAAIK